ncbi:transcriptional regulator [Marivivens niveibacter]|uniref:Transcriptional regulator n=1 Tax=Marivivens niveibacter TaxID=1930667 RepID=A0A251WVG2_9RHOB|nr:LacI family transcriptional regulator [Marivivens niveibacter]OUD08108.1 transcriptional regulator [Marivivens niveibacter]
MDQDQTATQYELLPGEKPTLKTISRLSGMAVPTVSRALNDAPDINVETKKTIREIADAIGYVPNRAGVRLRTGRTNVISLILAPENDMMNHTAQLINSITRELRGTNYHLNITPYFYDDDPLKPIRYVVENHSADAIIMNQTTPDDPRVRYLIDHNFPFATHGQTSLKTHPYFDFDNHAYAAFGVEYLVKRGRKHLVVVAPPRGQFYAEDTISGATEAAEKLGASLRIIRRINSDNSAEVACAALKDILTEDPTIDGIICSSPLAAMGAAVAIEKKRRVLGGDIDVFGKEAINFLRIFRRDIIVMKEDVARAGSFLARAAIEAIRDPLAPPMQGLQVPTEDDLAP